MPLRKIRVKATKNGQARDIYGNRVSPGKPNHYIAPHNFRSDWMVVVDENDQQITVPSWKMKLWGREAKIYAWIKKDSKPVIALWGVIFAGIAAIASVISLFQ